MDYGQFTLGDLRLAVRVEGSYFNERLGCGTPVPNRALNHKTQLEPIVERELAAFSEAEQISELERAAIVRYLTWKLR